MKASCLGAGHRVGGSFVTSDGDWGMVPALVDRKVITTLGEDRWAHASQCSAPTYFNLTSRNRIFCQPAPLCEVSANVPSVSRENFSAPECTSANLMRASVLTP